MSPHDDAESAACFGPYRVLRMLGQGGMAQVFVAQHAQTGALVALKTARDTADFATAQLRREAELLRVSGRANLPSLVSLLDCELDSRDVWLALELLDGPSLAERLDHWRARSALPEWLAQPDASATVPLGAAPTEHAERSVRTEPTPESLGIVAALAIISQLTAAIAHLHACGIVHGDVSPRNVLFRRDEGAVLIDLGAGFLAFDRYPSRERLVDGSSMHGTRGYIAPERQLGQVASVQSDLYGLGTLAKQLLRMCTTLPDSTSAWQQLWQKIEELVAEHPADRPASAHAFALALQRVSGLPLEVAQPPALGGLHRAGLIGRDAVCAAIDHKLREAAAGRGGVCLIVATAGLGKTRLLNDSLSAAAGRGFLAIGGSAGDAASRSSGLFTALVEELEGACRRDAGLAAELSGARAILREAFLAPSGAQPSSDSVELRKARVIDAFLTALQALSRSRPVVLGLDALEYGDELSLAVLESERLTQLHDSRVLVIGSYDERELHSDWSRDLAAISGERLRLEALSDAQVLEMLRGMCAGRQLDQELASFVLAQADGVPMLIVELAHEWAGAALANERPEARPAAPDNSAGGKLIARRLSQLDAESRIQLRVAAALGDELDESELIALTVATHDLSTLQAERAIARLCAERLLERSESGRLAFVLGGLGRRMAEALDPQARRSALLRLAEVCELRGMSDERVGRLFAQAEDRTRAYARLLRAARTAQQAGRVREARDLYELAAQQAWLDSAASAHAAAESGVFETLGDLFSNTGRYAPAQLWYERSHASAPATPLGKARCLRKLAQTCTLARDYARAHDEFARAEAALAEVTGPARTAEWLSLEQGRFWLRYYAGHAWQPSATRPLSEVIAQLGPLVDEHGAIDQRIAFHHCAAASLLSELRFAPTLDAVSHARTALALVEAHLPHELAPALFYFGFPSLWAGPDHWPSALEAFERAIDQARWIDDAACLARAQLYRAVSLRVLGRVEQTAAAAREALASAERVQSSAYLGAALSCEAWVCVREGRAHEAQRLLERSRRAWQHGKLRYPFLWLGTLPLAEQLRGAERFEEALTLLADLLSPDLAYLPPELNSAISAAIACDRTADALDRALCEVDEVAARHHYG